MVKDSQGSIHKSTFAEVQAINSKGTIIIGKNTDNFHHNVADIIAISVPNGDDDDRVYDLKKLQELVSRMVLIAQSGAEAVEGMHKFTEVNYLSNHQLVNL